MNTEEEVKTLRWFKGTIGKPVPGKSIPKQKGKHVQSRRH